MVVIHNGLLAYVVAIPAWIVICTRMPIQLLPPFAVVIHNGLLAYVVAIPAAVVICVGFSRTSVELPVRLIPSLSLRSSGYWEAGYVGISPDSR